MTEPRTIMEGDWTIGVTPRLCGLVTQGSITTAVWHGRCLDILRSLPDDHLSAIITDPPYGLSGHSPAIVTKAITAWACGDRERVPDGRGFMDMRWDTFVPPPAVWDECLRVLKPGGHMAVFAGTRTLDIMGMSIRLGGFEIRDSLQWLYSSGLPKGTSQLKPGHEPIILARKPLEGTLAATVATHGTGGLNIDGCRTETTDDLNGGTYSSDSTRNTRVTQTCLEGGILHNGIGDHRQPTGRWPANVVLSHSALLDPVTGVVIGDACADECAEDCPVAELDRQSGRLVSGDRKAGDYVLMGYHGAGKTAMPTVKGDTGGASRFYPTFRYQAKAPKSERPVVNGVSHPTVKPLALIEWLVTLITPPGGMIGDPFAGSGTLGEAARRLEFSSILIERERKYIPHIKERLTRTLGDMS